MTIQDFIDEEPDPLTQWRAIVLFGRNVACYKFAMAESLLELSRNEREFVPMEELAVPFADAACRHLSAEDRQCEQPTSRFLDACRSFNRDKIARPDLYTRTVALGFDNVIDAFHRVGADDVPQRFYLDERTGARPGIRVLPELLEVTRQARGVSLGAEVEARWRLVETAWNAGVPVKTVELYRDPETMHLAVELPDRRVQITGIRDALIGYQRGACFYCRAAIDVAAGSPRLGDVDHVLPWALRELMRPHNADGAWNLVLACAECNRGSSGKFDRLPARRFLENLRRRNDYYVASHHPLRETLMKQTGKTRTMRQEFLQARWDECRRGRPGSGWEPGGDPR